MIYAIEKKLELKANEAHDALIFAIITRDVPSAKYAYEKYQVLARELTDDNSWPQILYGDNHSHRRWTMQYYIGNSAAFGIKKSGFRESQKLPDSFLDFFFNYARESIYSDFDTENLGYRVEQLAVNNRLGQILELMEEARGLPAD